LCWRSFILSKAEGTMRRYKGNSPTQMQAFTRLPSRRAQRKKHRKAMAQRPSPTSHTTRIGFVSVALEVAMTFCRMAQTAEPFHQRMYLGKARKAYDLAVRYMFELDKANQEFDTLTANAERVKLMLQSLQPSHDRPSPPAASPTQTVQ
jgi:hypothetical protein